MKRILSSALAGFLALSAPALAGVEKGNGEIGFDLGGTSFDSNTTDATGDRLVFRGGYHFTKHFELEGQVAASLASEDVFGVNVDTALSTLFVDSVFNFRPTPNVVPYILAGIGTARLEYNGGGVTVSDNGTAYQLAAGSRFFFGARKRAGFRLELSRIRENTFDESATHTNFTGGFTWALGNQN